MNVFLHVPGGDRDAREDLYGRIRRAVDRDDLLIVTSGSEVTTSPDMTLENVDAFIIEGGWADTETGFLLAHAIAMKKPALVLYSRGTVAKVLNHMSLPTIPSWIAIVSYTDRTLERQIEDFLLAVGGRRVKPSPRIKFTLRITTQIEEFLRFKTMNTKTSKADWVRERLESLMANDQDWQAEQRRRSKASGRAA